MTPLEKLRYHVSGAIERGEAEAIVERIRTMITTPVPPKSLAEALDFLRIDGDHCLGVFTHTRTIMIDAKTVAKFEKAGAWLLKEEGDGYRLRQGKGSVYLFPGQLKAVKRSE